MTNNEKKDLDNLYQLLIQEYALYDGLMLILENKQQAIIRGKVEELQNLTAKEQALVRQATAYSDSRQYLIQKVLNDSNKENKLISLSNFLQLTNRSDDFRWKNIKHKLDKVAYKIKKLNFENHELLQTSLAFVKEMVRVFIPKDKNPNNLYSKEGKINNADKNTKVLNYQV